MNASFCVRLRGHTTSKEAVKKLCFEEGEQEEAFTSIATTLLVGVSGEAGADERRGTQEKRERLLFVRLRRHKTSQEVLLRGRRTLGGVHVHRKVREGQIHRCAREAEDDR